MSTGKSNQKLTRKKVNRETVDYMKVSMESDENLLLTESFPPTIKKPSTLLSTSVHSSFSSSSSRSSSSSSTSSAITTIRNDDKSLTGNENVDNSIGLRLQSTGTIKSRKPRLFRQPNALMDTSPNQPSASSSSHGDNLNPLPSSSTINDSSTIRSTFRPVPQVSVTLSSPDNPFDDSTIEFIDSDYEQQQSSGSPVNSDNLVTINQTNSEKIRNHLVETNKMESNENSNIGANSVETNDELNVSQESGGNINGPEGHSIGSVGGEGRSRTRYLTRTLALLKLQYLRKSRSEDTGDQETRNIRRLSERPTGLIGDPMIPSTHLGHHLNHHHASIANKSLSSASLCGSSLATSPPSSLLGPSLSKGDSGERGGNGNNIHPSSGNYPTGSLVNGSTSEPEPYILGIHVHNTDRKLKSAKSVVHPVVKIHIIDTETSSYLIKKHSDRDVAFYYETGNSKNNFILPVMTQNCDMLTRIRYPRYPIWEELLLYNEDYSHFLSDNVIIFFEILDFLTFSGPSDKRYNSMKRTEWWYRIAWAFLSLKSSDGSFNTGRKLRLQLYKPISQKVTIDPKNPHTTELFEWWKNQKLITFPGSIYVTVSPIPLIVSRETFCPSFRSYGPFQPETNSVPNYQQNYVNQTNGHFPHNDHHHHHHFNQGLPRRPSSAISNSTIERSPSTTSNPPGASGQQTNAVNKSLDSALELRLGTSSSSPGHNNKEIVHDPNQPIVIWNRLEGAPCKIPKNLWHQFSAGNNKCSYAIKFSWDGRKVACGASVFTAYRSNEKRSSIFIYEIPSGRFMKRVNGFHSGAIYEIDWSPNDKYLVSASSDCTAHVWNNVKEYQSSILLPHPCFVYTARFHVTRSGIVFTGSYDGLIRIWCIKLSLESTAVEPQLVQEIDCFYGQVLSLAWKIIPPPPPPSSSSSSNSNIVHSIPIVTLFASGSKGEIVTLSQRDVTSDFTWYLSGSIKINEIIEVPVNNIVVHPQSNKILICCRDGVQRMIDYQLELIVQRFTGSLNFHHLIRGCLSPCGRFVFAGGEDSLVHCWNADTGEKLFTYNELPFKGPISCVEFHPLDNILAICGLNARTISVCLFNHELPKVITPKPIVGKSIQSSNMITASSSSTKQGSLNDSINSLSNHSKSDSSGKTSSRFELLRSKTIDQSNNVSESGAIRRGNFKVQRAMRRLEFALRTKSIDKR